ncbi:MULTISPECIES: BMP family lipoprotein [Mumia]|uniref:BMP family lipoprotein n=1 Tax=Mumia TaxID=1546255 RepID=UPI00141DDAE9|nr:MULTISPECIES: BMP family ABC transporter substrate-binding protein [unclassified Mumia]QMW65642.1 BMP family ABC transporter substrate-binding protein [Mumia sp. ZJ1417]
MGKITALAAVAVLALAGCGSDDDNGGDDDNAGSSNTLDCSVAEGDGPKVGIAYDVGGQGDKSFNDAAAVGVKKAVDELGARCTEAEAQDGEAESAREDRLRQLADAEHDPIIAVGFLYSEAVNKVAPDYPDVSFDVVDGFDPDDQANDNVAYLTFAEEQGSFLVGAAAALKSTTNNVGFVGGVNSDLIKKFEAGYAAGAKAVKPDIKIQVKYIEESDASGFNDPAGGKAAATGMFDQGADVVYHAAGGSGAGVFQSAVEAGDGMWAIGVDSDQWQTASDTEKPHILTSMLKRVDVAAYDAISAVAEDSPLVGYQTYDLAKDGVGYATSGGYVDDIIGDLDGYADQIKSGEIKVPTAP